MAETIDARFEELGRQVRRLRVVVLVLAVGFAAVLTLGAASRSNELTVKRLAIVDDERRERIVSVANPDGTAAVFHYDRDGKPRIVAMTTANGSAVLSIADRSGNVIWSESSK